MKLEEYLVKGFAQQYAALGWSVMPINNRSKRPSAAWEELQHRRMTEEEIERARWQNVGIITGTISGVCVIDEDDLSNLSEDERQRTQAFLGMLPPTLTSITGKGKHRYYRLPAPQSPSSEEGDTQSTPEAENAVAGQEQGKERIPVPTRVRFLPGLDCRGEGGYALAPPSIHPSGHVYVWAQGWGEPSEESDYAPYVEMAELPDWAADIISQGNGESQALWKEAVEGTPEGKRNATAASFIGRLIYGQDPKMYPIFWSATKSWNERNTPPLPESELRSVFDSIAKHRKEPVVSRIERATIAEFEGTGEELLRADLHTLPHTIGDLLPAGLAILAGKPKLGKSRLALQFSLAIAQGAAPFQPLSMGAYRLSGATERGRVVYLALEDSASRLQSRLRSVKDVLDGAGRSSDFLQRITFCTTFSSLFRGGAASLQTMIEKDSSIRLIVIDTLAAFTFSEEEQKASRENAFVIEYRTMRPLLDLVLGKQVTVLVVHHARKDQAGFGSAQDPFDAIQGTLGSSAVADTLMMLYEQRHRGREPQTVLAGKGRDIDGYELPLLSRGLLWSIGKHEYEDEDVE